MNIQKLKPQAAMELIYGPHLSMLSQVNQETMTRAIGNSDWVWIGDVDGEVFGFWGLIAPTLCSNRAYLWFYATDSFCRHIFRFIRHSREVTAELLSYYPILVGHGRSDDAKSLRWLKWCGAEFGAPVANGAAIPFEIRSV
jgi:hypothetical protein